MDGQGNAANQLPYGGAFQPNPELAAALGANAPFQYPVNQPPQQQFTFEQTRQQQDIELEQQLRAFWAAQYHQIDNLCDFKNQSLPLARIKKIMKSDEDVRMISAEAPVVFARACEMFIMELTMRSWNQTEENRRRTLQRNDISAAVARTDLFDFLVDIIPREEDVLAGAQRGAVPVPPPPTEGIPFYPIHYAEAGTSSNGMLMDGSESNTKYPEAPNYAEDPNAYVYPDFMPAAAMWPQPGEPSSSGGN